MTARDRAYTLISRTDGIAVDLESELCSFCWFEVVWWRARLR